MVDLHTVEVEVLGSINNGYRLKVGVIDLGQYMYGWTARHSDKNSTGWWIQPAAYNKNGKWIITIEFDKSKTFWQQLEKECVEAINEYESKPEELEITDDDLSPESIAKGIDEVCKRYETENKQEPPKAIPWLNDEED